MLKPPAANIPGMTDTLDFVKNLWGSMSIPGTNMSGIPGMPTLAGMATPPMSVEDFDKRIADLKAVESWLNINVTMLRGTIHTMEVQRSTVAALNTMGASMADALRKSGVSTENLANMPFASFFGQAPAGAAPTGAAPNPAPAPAAPQSAPSAGATPEGTTPPLALPAAMAWWNQLQDQFTQAVATAMTPQPGAEPSAGAKQDTPPAATPVQPDTNGKPRAGRSKSDKT
jgi:hypothetical protein